MCKLRLVLVLLLAQYCGSQFAAHCNAQTSIAIDPSKGVVDESTKTRWFDLQHLPIEGKGWKETVDPFDRLPKKAKGSVRDAVWNLSRQSAGICARFVTNSGEIHAKWELTSANLDMPHMPSTGVSGLDLYVRDEQGKWRWLANGRPSAQANATPLVKDLESVAREYLLYLPLYNGVSSVSVGIAADALLSEAPPYPAGQEKPIVFYGTSITQGGCASRPGMVHTAILGRQLNYPVINLGFSGNGKMEKEVTMLMAEIEASLYVVDCLPNMTADEVRERTIPLVHDLRAMHPSTPILLVEDRSYSDSFVRRGNRDRNETNRAALREQYNKLIAEGISQLYYLEGNDLLGDDNEGTVDSSHPTDLGFYRQALVFEKSIRGILGPKP